MSQTKLYRQLVRVIAVCCNGAYVIVPGYDAHESTFVYYDDVPYDIAIQMMSAIDNNTHFYAQVNFDAESLDTMVFRDWEVG